MNSAVGVVADPLTPDARAALAVVAPALAAVQDEVADARAALAAECRAHMSPQERAAHAVDLLEQAGAGADGLTVDDLLDDAWNRYLAALDEPKGLHS